MSRQCIKRLVHGCLRAECSPRQGPLDRVLPRQDTAQPGSPQILCFPGKVLLLRQNAPSKVITNRVRSPRTEYSWVRGVTQAKGEGKAEPTQGEAKLLGVLACGGDTLLPHNCPGPP